MNLLSRTIDSVLLLIVLSATVAPTNGSNAADTAPPNFVLIYVDDLGYADLGCYGNEYHETPNIDRLMTDGLRFTQAYADAPLSAPSRVALLSGRRCARAGCYDVYPKRIIEGVAPEQVGFVPPESIWNLPTGRTILPQFPKQIGYRTGCFGKWHVGPMIPGRRGFDEFVSLRTTSHTDVGQSLIGRSKDSPAPEGYSSDSITECAVPFIDQHQDEPFFHFLPTFLELAGHPRAKAIGEALDGKSLALLLRDADATWPDRELFWHYPGYRISNARMMEWQRPESSMRFGKWKMIESLETGAVPLYDLNTDVGETHDVAAAHPKVVSRLRRRLKQWREETDAPMPVRKDVSSNVVDAEGIAR